MYPADTTPFVGAGAVVLNFLPTRDGPQRESLSVNTRWVALAQVKTRSQVVLGLIAPVAIRLKQVGHRSEVFIYMPGLILEIRPYVPEDNTSEDSPQFRSSLKLVAVKIVAPVV